MRVTLNGQSRDVAKGLSLADVVAQLTDAPRGIAVALNAAVVPRGNWAATTLADDDRIEVLTAVQGG